MKQWYKANSGNHQGLIIDEKTGDNIAISYKKEDADLIAAAPDLLEALQLYITDCEVEGLEYNTDCYELAKQAINKAEV